MLRLTITVAALVSLQAFAQAPATPEKKEGKDIELKKKEVNLTVDKSLAGDITRKQVKKDDAPTLKYDQFRLGIELQVGDKRREQITDLKKIIQLSQDQKEKPSLLFRLGELYWEESKAQFFEANRKDDDKIKAMNNDDKAGVEKAEAEKNEILVKSKEYAQLAIEQYSKIIQEHKDFARTDEVLYFLGLNLMEMNDDRRAILSYNRLIDKFPKSKYLPDSFLARAEYYFNNSKGKRDQLEKALDNYKSATKYPENAVYGYALYKQGWCYFNMGDYDKAMDQFKTVVLYAEFAGQEAVEGKKGSKSSRAGLAKEARNDYVRAYSRAGGTPTDAKDKFSKLAQNPEDLRLMMKQLANLYYEDGKDKEAALTFDMLIKERPTATDAPGFQAKIIDCVLRAGNKRMTVQQVRRLVKITEDVNAANKSLDEKAKKSLDEARELSERTISNLAVNWHNEAKKTRDEDTYGFANEVYSDYLTLFPDNAKAYDLRFFWATMLTDWPIYKYEQGAQEYTKVLAADIAKVDKQEKGEDGQMRAGKPGKWMNDASYNAIIAWQEVVKKAIADGKIKSEPVTDPNKKLTIPPEKKSLLEAFERYLKYVEKGAKRVDIAYQAARIYYEYNYLDEAIGRYADIALKYPDYKMENGDRVGEMAANQVLDSYNLLGDWTKVNEWARKFIAEPKLAPPGGEFYKLLQQLIEQSTFKMVNALEAKKDYAAAADGYMKFVNEFPKSDLADKAVFNASINYFNARMLDKAIEVRKLLIQKYPKSQYVPQTMFALAEGYEAITDFAAAADYYETYATAYEKSKGPAPKKAAPKAAPKAKKGAKSAPPPPPAAVAAEQVWEEAKAQDALFNAGIFREGLQQFPKALIDRNKYLDLWPTSKDVEAVTKSIIDLLEKMNKYGPANAKIEEYEKTYIKDPNKVLWGEGRIATNLESKMGNAKQARRIYVRILDYYEKLTKKQKEALEPNALDAVGRASFAMNDDDWARYNNLKLRWSSLMNIGELKGSIAAKGRGLEELQKVYTKTVTLKSADPAICALYKIGLGYDAFANALDNPPEPKGITEELLVEVKAQFAEQSKPIREKAAEAFASVVQKSQELDVFNPCTTSALEMLRTKYAPEKFPKMGEDVLPLVLDTSKSTVIGGDVLTTIQPVQVLSPEKAAEMKNKANGAGRDVADSSTEPGAKNDAPAPRKGTAPVKKKTSNDEPEESL